MARRVKDKYLGARVDDDMSARVDTYIAAAHITMGDLLRAAVTEYMINHPAKTSVKPAQALTGKGGTD